MRQQIITSKAIFRFTRISTGVACVILSKTSNRVLFQTIATEWGKTWDGLYARYGSFGDMNNAREAFNRVLASNS
jgi:hypothetical protein